MTKEAKEKKIKGCVAVLVTDDGSVAATATDFDYTHAAGYRLADAQERRARQALASEFVMTWVGRRVGQYIDNWDSQKLMDNMVQKAKWKIHYQLVNHDEDEK